MTELVRSPFSESERATPEDEITAIPTGDVQSTMPVLTKMKHTLKAERNRMEPELATLYLLSQHGAPVQTVLPAYFQC